MNISYMYSQELKQKIHETKNIVWLMYNFMITNCLW